MFSENESIQIFDDLSGRFSQIRYNRKENDKEQISKILSDLNSLDFRYPLVTNATKAVLLIHQCCSLVSPDDANLAVKCSQLITNLVNRQHVLVEGTTFTLAVRWCLQVSSTAAIAVDALVALDALLRSNPDALQVTEVLVRGPLMALAQKNDPEMVLAAMQCLEACTNTPEGKSISLLPDICDIFLNYLKKDKLRHFSDVVHCKILTSCLRALQNIVVKKTAFLEEALGLLIGITKIYMVYGVNGVEFTAPQKVTPSVLDVAESPVAKEKKGGKLTKQRKHRAQIPANKKSETQELERGGRYVSATYAIDIDYDNLNNSLSSRLKTSDSDFSDTESDRGAQLVKIQGRVRQAALNLLLHVIKLSSKPVIFCYWSSLIPGSPSTGSHSLTTCILKEPSARGRLAALNVLLALITSSKQYLAQAELSEKFTAYTSFSVILGSMLKELHKSLVLALNEYSIPVLIQVLKCLAALVQATPYHRLSRGLVTKIMRNVKLYVKHKDVTIQVAALIVLGCILVAEPVVPETRVMLLKHVLNVDKSPKKKDANQLDEVGYVDFSSDDDDAFESDANHDVPWLLALCLRNLGVELDENCVLENIPPPVKLESLQVLSAMTRNYFDCLVVPYLGSIAKGLNVCLADKYADLRLHAGRTVDFIGQAMNQHLNSSGCTDLADPAFTFWQSVIDPLGELLQCEQHTMLRAVGCDCFGSIGAHVFDRLPREKQIFVITLLFACSRDEENSVKAAAVRALAICVLYPSLREDTGFVVDVAEAVCRTLQEENTTLRTKASWSLGNLSDALVLNKSKADVEEFPDSLLLKLLELSVKITTDNDKIKVNAARALGNILHLITGEHMESEAFRECVEKALTNVVKAATSGANMKVRWNSCHALGKVLKNPALYPGDLQKVAIFDSLIDVVISFRNFKVRINAASALSSPTTRTFYGSHFYVVWRALLEALANAQNIEDFSEYNHRDHLIEQICLSLGRLILLVTKEDLVEVGEDAALFFDLLKVQMHRVVDRVVPEKASVLLAAVEHLKGFKSNLTDEETKAVAALKEVFTNDVY